jgi:hypothetical protein
LGSAFIIRAHFSAVPPSGLPGPRLRVFNFTVSAASNALTHRALERTDSFLIPASTLKVAQVGSTSIPVKIFPRRRAGVFPTE